MGITTGVSNSKRAGVGEDYSKRQRLGSQELPQLSTNLGSIPLEIMQIVASHLAERKDLESFSKISYLTKSAALREINLQNKRLAITELKVLSDLNSPKPDQASSPIDFYKKFLADLVDPNIPFRVLGAQIDVNKLQELQQKLTALATNQVADQFRALKLVCYKEIASGKASIERINEKYESLKCALVCEALKLVISSSVDPEVTIGQAVGLAAQSGHITVVQALLADGEISEEDRGWAVRFAAQKGHLEIVNDLLANVEISEDNRGGAVVTAALNGHLKVVQALLANGEISEDDRGFAVYNSAKIGHLEVVKALLANGPISEDYRDSAIRGAVAGGHHSVADYLRKNQGWSCSVM